LIAELLQWIESLGYWGIMLGLMIEIIPSEIVLAYGGYLVAQGKISFVGAVVFGIIGGTVAQWFLYWIGLYGGRPFVEKYGKYLLIRPHHLEVAERWCERYGAGVIFTGRFVPVVRHAISVPAGIAKMPFWRFTVLTVLAMVPWSVFFIYLGMKLGENWKRIKEEAAPYVGPIVAGAVLLAAVYFIWKRRRSARQGGTEGGAGDAPERLFGDIGGEYRVLSGRRLKLEDGVREFDHIVVGPNGVFHIDAGSGREGGPADSRLYRREYALRRLLREHGIEADVVGVVCVGGRTGDSPAHAGGAMFAAGGRESAVRPPFLTVTADRLAQTIRSHIGRRPPLSSETVERIARLIESRCET